jgi:hypothetical protein
MVARACNPCPWRLRQEDWVYKASLGYTVRLCLKKHKKNFDTLHNSIQIRELGFFSWEILSEDPNFMPVTHSVWNLFL